MVIPLGYPKLFFCFSGGRSSWGSYDVPVIYFSGVICSGEEMIDISTDRTYDSFISFFRRQAFLEN